MSGQNTSKFDDRDGRIEELWTKHRSYLISVAFRIVGNISDAEDIVQEAFTRLLPVELDEIDDVRGWLVVVAGRLCLDQLRSARSRTQAGPDVTEHALLDVTASEQDPADRVTLDDTVNMALLVVMQRLSPAERAVFVLHDVFRFSFDAVASIVGRTPAACRQIAGRARRRVEEGTGPGRFAVEPAAQRQVAERFIAACAGGDMEALMELLDADVVGDVDLGPDVPPRAPIVGRDQVVKGILGFFRGTGVTLVAQPINGQPGALAFRNRRLAALLSFETRDGLIVDIHAIGDRRKLALVQLQMEA